jgi:hypothetical protein
MSDDEVGFPVGLWASVGWECYVLLTQPCLGFCIHGFGDSLMW